MEAMGHAYVQRVENDRDSLLLQMQQYAACYDEDIQTTVRACMSSIWNAVVEISGEPVEEVAVFIAKGMMCNVLAASGRSGSSDPEWEPVLRALWPDKYDEPGHGAQAESGAGAPAA
jgi:hypothetical protein